MKNKNSSRAVILIILLAMLLLKTANAETLSESLTLSLEKTNDFFAREQYKAYVKTIDFFAFSLLFISVYLIGVKYAFKEVNKPEKAIALVLGLMSAFLMISQDYSITKLVAFLPFFLYFLLFALCWWLLKGMKSKFWRFVLALFITLIAAVLVEGFFNFKPEEFADSLAIFIPFKNENNN